MWVPTGIAAARRDMVVVVAMVLIKNVCGFDDANECVAVRHAMNE